MSIERVFKVEEINNDCEIINIEDKGKKDNNLCKKIQLFFGERNYFRIDTERNFVKVNEIFEDRFYRQNSDGLLINPLQKLIVVIELKTKLNRGKFKKAINQMMATFFKITVLLSLVYPDFLKFRPIFIFAFKDKETIREDEMKMIDSSYLEEVDSLNTLDRLYFNIQKKLDENSTPLEVRIERIPVNDLEHFNSNLEKRNVRLVILECERSYKVDSILNNF